MAGADATTLAVSVAAVWLTLGGYAAWLHLRRRAVERALERLRARVE